MWLLLRMQLSKGPSLDIAMRNPTLHFSAFHTLAYSGNVGILEIKATPLIVTSRVLKTTYNNTKHHSWSTSVHTQTYTNMVNDSFSCDGDAT